LKQVTKRDDIKKGGKGIVSARNALTLKGRSVPVRHVEGEKRITHVNQKSEKGRCSSERKRTTKGEDREDDAGQNLSLKNDGCWSVRMATTRRDTN